MSTSLIAIAQLNPIVGDLAGNAAAIVQAAQQAHARGARLLLTAALELHRTRKRYALCTMCIGVGQGYAAILERA